MGTSTLPGISLSILSLNPDREPQLRQPGKDVSARLDLVRHDAKALGELAAIVRKVVPTQPGGIDPATRTFQALRIAVNDELGSLEAALPAALAMLRPGGRFAVISFHSLEDRIVKQFLRDKERGCTCPPDFPVCVCGHEPELRAIERRPIRPSAAEIAANPRSSSARLRAAVKT